MTLPGGGEITQAFVENRTSSSGRFSGEVKVFNWSQGWGFIVMESIEVLPSEVAAKLKDQTKAAEEKAKASGKEAYQEPLIYFRWTDCSKKGVGIYKGTK